jgi:hypothetical protein
VYAAIDHPGAPVAGHPAHGVTAQGIAGVDADAHNISGGDAFGMDRFQRFIDEDGIARSLGCGRGQNEQPARCNDRRAEGIVAGIYKMNSDWINLSSCG